MSDTRENGLATLEAIATDPWNAILGDLPDGASSALYLAIAEAAGSLYVTPAKDLRVPAALSDMDPIELGELLRSRWQDADYAAETACLQEAWRAPVFSRDTFAADMWTSTYLPIPENAEPALLIEARRLAEFCRDLIVDHGPDFGPLLRCYDRGPDANSRRASDRIAELDTLLQEWRDGASAFRYGVVHYCP